MLEESRSKYILFLMGILVLLCLAYLMLFYNDAGTSDYVELHAILMVAITSIIALVAYTELSSISRTAKIDFLMELDKRYGSSEIIQARQIIHRLYRDTKNNDSKKFYKVVKRYHKIKKSNEKKIHSLTANLIELLHWRQIGKKINKLSQSSDHKSQDEYILLLNLLDFLESISFYANNKYIEKKHLNDLMGISITFFYSIFKLRITRRRKKYETELFYNELEDLANEIHKDRKRSPD